MPTRLQSRQLFPTCQVRVVRFYVSCLLRLLFFSSSSSLSPTAMMWAQCPLPNLNRDRVSSAFRAGPQPRSCVAQCASGDASWRGSVYWKTSWGEGHLRGYNQIRLHLAYGYAYARLREKPSTVLVFCCQFLLFTDVGDSTSMTS